MDYAQRLDEITQRLEARQPMIRRKGKGIFNEGKFALHDQILYMVEVNGEEKSCYIVIDLLENGSEQEIVESILACLGLN